MPRLFVAVWPPAPVLDVIAELPRKPVDGVRWTTARQWHVTLRFLGDTDRDVAVAALDRVEAAATVAVLRGPIETLGEGLVMAPVDGLDPLAAAVDRAVGDLAPPRPADGFRGHLTLARHRREPPPVVGRALPEVAFPVEELALVASDLQPDGARYTTVTTRALRP